MPKDTVFHKKTVKKMFIPIDMEKSKREIFQRQVENWTRKPCGDFAFSAPCKPTKNFLLPQWLKIIK